MALIKAVSRKPGRGLTLVKTRSLWTPAYLKSWRPTHPRALHSDPKKSNPALEQKDSSAYHGPPPAGRERDLLAQRDFFRDVLTVNATKRDAKQYLSRFKDADKLAAQVDARETEIRRKRDTERLRQRAPGVNLGNLYVPARAIAEAPQFTQHVIPEESLKEDTEKVVHVALVSIRNPREIEDSVLDGIALTLSQLVMLDMQIVVVFDCGEQKPGQPFDAEEYQRQGARIVKALDQHNDAGARYIDSALSVQVDHSLDRPAKTRIHGPVSLQLRDLVMEPLRRTVVPVLPTIAYSEESQKTFVKQSDAMLALTRSLSRLPQVSFFESGDPLGTREGTSLVTELDRIIMVDPQGGLPSTHREDKAHAFVNLEQEYEDITQELLHSKPNLDMEFLSTFTTAENLQHMSNLTSLRDCLALLPPASSALLISPQEAANSAEPSSSASEPYGTRTRRQKNPLIYNLLTNKPVVSSSLPAARVTANDLPSESSLTPTRSTMVKRGMPLTIVPDPRFQVWTAPSPGQPSISLENNPDINLPRLVSLIEDSFRRPLDVQHYLDRIRDKIAGIIIAGEYEGGAILTWELPPPPPGAFSSYTPQPVPYLDKFAVAQRSQGSSGVADIVFQAVLRSCFPKGVAWRSRNDNPVNKWYFERAKGTYQIPDSGWTMFWTTEGLESDKRRWEEYVSVCRAVKPSWSDGKAKLD